jgi:hypothetical protein
MWDIKKPTINCQYITRQDYFDQKIQIEACTNESAKRDICKEFSKHNIVNAFMHEDLPLSDQLHGIYCMTPPERLHTRSEGLTKYMIDSLCNTIGDVGHGKKLLTKIENLYHTFHFHLKRNSKHNFPRGSARNGALKNTLVSATECHGNMFLLLCLCHTDAVRKDFKSILCHSGINSANFFKCLKLYTLMEEWFHKNNLKDEVNSAYSFVAETLELLYTCFPQWDKDGNEEGQGWAVSTNLFFT